MPSWPLDDADPIAADNPCTFCKPSSEVIARVRPGDVVKPIFRFESDDPEAPAAERMWVMVDECLDDGEKVGYLCREAPDNEQESGWRITSGHGSDEYMDDPKNVSVVSLGAVLSRDDACRDLLASPIGSAFALHPVTGTFEPDQSK